MRVPLIMQLQPSENGASALAMILAFHGKHLPIAHICDKCKLSKRGSSPENIADAANAFSLKATVNTFDLENLRKQPLPAIVQWNKRYFVVVTKISKNSVKINDPFLGTYSLKTDAFLAKYSGKAITFEKTADFTPEGKPITLWSLLFNRLQGRKMSFFILLLLHGIGVFLNMAVFMLIQVMLDNVLSGDHPSWYAYILICMSILVLLRLTLSIISSIYSYRISRAMAGDAGAKMVKQLLHLPLSFFEQHSSGELIQRIHRSGSLDRSLLLSLTPNLVNGVTTILYLILLFSYSIPLSLLCLTAEILYLIFSSLIQKKLADTARSASISSGTMNSSLLAGLNILRDVRAMGAERGLYKKFSTAQEAFYSSQVTRHKNRALAMILNILNNYLSLSILIFIGAFLIINGQFALGMLASFQVAMDTVKKGIAQLIKSSDTLREYQTDIERANDILENKIDPPIPFDDDDPEKLSGAIEIKGLSFKYSRSDDLALEDISISIAPGQVIALVGHTGCGKSTLLKLLAGLYKFDQGAILYDGKSREQISDVVFYSSVSTIEQEPTFFQDSISANIKMWDNTIEDYEMKLAAGDAQIHSRIIRSPNDYLSLFEKNGHNFSGGELQRIALARALAIEPTILLLDEFTSALDSLIEQKVMNAVKARGNTLIIAAHRLSTIMDADQILVFDKGRIVERGTHSELYNMNGLYKQLFDLR